MSVEFSPSVNLLTVGTKNFLKYADFFDRNVFIFIYIIILDVCLVLLVQIPWGCFVHDVNLNPIQEFNGIVIHSEGGVMAIKISFGDNQVDKFSEQCRPADFVVGSVVQRLEPLKQNKLTL